MSDVTEKWAESYDDVAVNLISYFMGQIQDYIEDDRFSYGSIMLCVNIFSSRILTALFVTGLKDIGASELVVNKFCDILKQSISQYLFTSTLLTYNIYSSKL